THTVAVTVTVTHTQCTHTQCTHTHTYTHVYTSMDSRTFLVCLYSRQDADQMFSKWAAIFNGLDIRSRLDLEAELLRSYPNLTVVQLGGDQPVANWSHYVKPRLKPGFDGHSLPHAFALLRTDDSDC